MILLGLKPRSLSFNLHAAGAWQKTVAVIPGYSWETRRQVGCMTQVTNPSHRSASQPAILTARRRYRACPSPSSTRPTRSFSLPLAGWYG